jgi:hypothetical protein
MKTDLFGEDEGFDLSTADEHVLLPLGRLLSLENGIL